MTVILKTGVFLHIPKTGGVWVKQCLSFHFPEDFLTVNKEGTDPHIPLFELQGLFDNPALVREYAFRNVLGEELGYSEKLRVLSELRESHKLRFFTFIRHPVSWWRSYWRYRQDLGWNEMHWIDSCCRADNYDEFIVKVLENLPGACSGLAREYIGNLPTSVNGVGKQEQIAADLSLFLSTIGIFKTEDQLCTLPRVNFSITPAPLLRPDLEAALVRAESDLIESYY